MDLRKELAAGMGQTGPERQRLYAALLGSTLYIREPREAPLRVTDPSSGRRAVPAFLTAADAAEFWAQAAPTHAVDIGPIPFAELCQVAREGVVVDPLEANCFVDRGEVMQLAVAEVPGAFTAWMAELGRLGRTPDAVMARLKKSFVYVLAGKDGGEEPRLYLLEKSEDGTLAVPCFSGVQTLQQFVEVRQLTSGHQGYTVALMEGERCLRIASGMGAYLLVDPESPWETQLEPTLL